MKTRILERVLRTDEAIAPTVVRVALGAVMFAHGAQKALGWFGGYGFSATMDGLTGMGLPGLVAFLVILAEFAGAAALIAGAGGRVMAGGIAAVMAGALVIHLPNGFFMDWFGAGGGQGIEFHILALAMAASVIVTGSGAWSVDRWLLRRLETPAERAPSLVESAA